MDMPVPAVAEWEWLNWKFPRAVRAGDTIYARWTLTQKRAPVGDSPTAIVVWRVDVHTATGALCAEGEVGASVLRKFGAMVPARAQHAPMAAAAPPAAAPPSAGGAPPAPRRRRRRRPPIGDGAKAPAEARPVVAAPADATPSAPSSAERATTSGTRRRRRRRPPSSAARNGEGPASPASVEAPAASVPDPAAPASSPNPLTRAIRRLRR